MYGAAYKPPYLKTNFNIEDFNTTRVPVTIVMTDPIFNNVTVLGTVYATGIIGGQDQSHRTTIESMNATSTELNQLVGIQSIPIQTQLNSKLPLNGGTMTGTLDMGINPVHSAYPASASNDITNKFYVDSQDFLKLNLTGGTMTGNIAMGANNIQTTYVPIYSIDLANKNYVDSQDALQLNLTGGTLTGNLAMGANKITSSYVPISSTDLTNKTYVDTAIGGSSYLSLSGGTMTGAIAMGANKITTSYAPISTTDLTNKTYVDTTINNASYLPLAGGTMAGTINLNSYSITGGSIGFVGTGTGNNVLLTNYQQWNGTASWSNTNSTGTMQMNATRIGRLVTLSPNLTSMTVTVLAGSWSYFGTGAGFLPAAFRPICDTYCQYHMVQTATDGIAGYWVMANGELQLYQRNATSVQAAFSSITGGTVFVLQIPTISYQST